MIVGDVEYRILHYQVRRIRGEPELFPCAHADKTCSQVMVWANISGEYLGVDDFMPLCQSHHKRYDYTPDSRARNSASHTGVPLSPEHSAAISAGWTPEKRAAAALRMAGTKRGPYKPRRVTSRLHRGDVT
jgi:hypothetical protein